MVHLEISILIKLFSFHFQNRGINVKAPDQQVSNSWLADQNGDAETYCATLLDM